MLDAFSASPPLARRQGRRALTQSLAEDAERDCPRNVLRETRIAALCLLEHVENRSGIVAGGLGDQLHRLVAAHDHHVFLRGNPAQQLAHRVVVRVLRHGTDELQPHQTTSTLCSFSQRSVSVTVASISSSGT